MSGRIKEILDISFRSAGDNNLEPRCLCSRVCESSQNPWTSLSSPTLVKRVNDKDKSAAWAARNGADEIDEEEILHCLRCQMWVVTKPFCDNISKWGEDSGEFVDKSWKDISRLAQIHIISTAEKCSSKSIPVVKARTDRMSKRRFADPW